VVARFSAAAITALAFLTLVVIVATGRPWFDLAIAQWIAERRSAAGVDAAEILSIAGSVVGIVPLGLLVAFVVYRRDGWREARWLFFACIGASSLYLLVNVVMRSARPPMPLRVLDDVGWSFPSGHATQSIVFWPMAALLLGTTRTMRAWLLVPAVIITLAIGGSRIYLDVHWTTDVTSGFLLGATWLFTVLALRRART
jgi:undecaprenyl-diphosphatase